MSAHLILPADVCGPDHPEWHEARRAGVTASEIPVVMGLVPGDWNSPFNLYHVKTGELDPPPESDVQRMGRWLEPFVLDTFAQRHPEYHLAPSGLYAHPDRPWQLATPDAPLHDDVCRCDAAADPELLCTCLPDEGEAPVAAVEAKSMATWDGWGDEGTGDIPVHYQAQAMWQADVLGVPQVIVAALNRQSGEYREYAVAHDDAECALMRKEAEAFLNRVTAGEAPPIDAAPATTRALKELHPDVEDVDVTVGRQLESRYRSALRKARAAEERKQFYTNRVLAAIGGGRRAVSRDGEVIATRSVHDRTSVDTKRLRKDQPDVAAQYSTTAPVTRLNPAKETT